jgi:hypothetical protein
MPLSLSAGSRPYGGIKVGGNKVSTSQEDEREQAEPNIGHVNVIAVRGAVIDVSFNAQDIPPIGDGVRALKLRREALVVRGMKA